MSTLRASAQVAGRRRRARGAVPGARSRCRCSWPVAGDWTSAGWRRTGAGTRPELKLERGDLAEFPAQFEAYYNDAFGLRDPLIRGNNLARVSLLGVSTSSKVMIGKRGWLYYAAEGAVDDLGAVIPCREELERWARALEERRDWLARRGIRYLVMFAPNKHTIYPEFCPVVRPGRGLGRDAVRSALPPPARPHGSSCSTCASRS